ncbi:MAG: hypothetical protein H7332_00095 [Bdellovibrionales bacterium]|nr:hypothetical protein [Ramlibacter sp.]
MRSSNVIQARRPAPTHRAGFSEALTGDGATAEVVLGKLKGEQAAAEEIRDRVSTYLDVAKCTLPKAAGQLATFLAARSTGMMAIQAGLPPPPEPPMTSSAKELLEIHGFVEKLDAQCSNAHSRVVKMSPRGAAAPLKPAPDTLKAEMQASSFKLRALNLMFEDACLEMPGAHEELKKAVAPLRGRAMCQSGLSVKATLLFQMLTAKSECSSRCEAMAKKIGQPGRGPVPVVLAPESRQVANEAAYPVLPLPPSAMRAAHLSRVHANKLGVLQTSHLENLELQAGVQDRFRQASDEHPEAALAMWKFLHQRSFADMQVIASESGYLLPGFDDLLPRVRELVELHAQCLAIAADCVHTESQILDLGSRPRHSNVRQRNSDTVADQDETVKLKSGIERNNEDIRKAYLVVTNISVTNPEVLEELKAGPPAPSAGCPTQPNNLSQQARLALFYDSVRSEKYRDNASLQAQLNSRLQSTRERAWPAV